MFTFVTLIALLFSVLPSATRDTFTINFVCDPTAHPGSLKLLQEELSTSSHHVVHNVFFEFSTALACIPAPVDCQIIGIHTANTHSSDFYMSVGHF